MSAPNYSGVISLQKAMMTKYKFTASFYGPAQSTLDKMLVSNLKEEEKILPKYITPCHSDGVNVRVYPVIVRVKHKTLLLRSTSDRKKDVSHALHFTLSSVVLASKSQKPRGVRDSHQRQMAKENEYDKIQRKYVKSFMVLDSTSPEMAEAFIEQRELMTAVEGQGDEMVDIVYHLVSQETSQHPSFFKLLEKLQERSCQGGNIQRTPLIQIIVNNSKKGTMLKSIYHMRSVFHRYVDKTCFPLLDGQQIEQEPTLSEADTPEAFMPEKISNCYLAEPLLMCNLTSHVKFSKRHSVDIRFEKGIELLLGSYANKAIFMEAMTDLSNAMMNARNQLPAVIREYPKVTFLGTGAACSSIFRNATGILLETSHTCSLLMDCGEGTVQQLRRLYNQADYERKLRSLQLVLVSHLHSDHFLGISSLMLERKKAFQSVGLDRDPPLHILAPHRLLPIIQNSNPWDTAKFTPSFHVFTIVARTEDQSPFHDCNWMPEWKQLMQFMNIEITPVFVPHCLRSMGFVISSRNDNSDTKPWKIVYSGDSRPSDPLVAHGKNCDLLIHEATFPSDQQEMAIKKCHSTTDEAIEQGRRMQAQFILLTHFSQRFSKIPLVEQQIDNMGFAFDHMTVNLDTVKLMSVVPPWFKYFAPHFWKTQLINEEKVDLAVLRFASSIV